MRKIIVTGGYGVMFATNISSNCGTDEEFLGSFSIIEVKYGEDTYTSSLTTPAGIYYLQTGTTVTQGVVSIPISKINSSNRFSKIGVKGNWWITRPEGSTLIVVHGLVPFPKSFKHTWFF